jgi:phospholipase/lecithinase/hemolysin
LLPVAAGKATFAASASSATNKWLDRLLSRDKGLDGVRILRLKVFRLIDAIWKDPTHFGFYNVTEPCIGTSICSDPDHRLFFDAYHPTQFAHAYFAVEVDDILDQIDKD